MTNSTLKLHLPFIMPAQAQKHVTHNEALQILDNIIQLVMQSVTQNAPPSNAEDGQVWFVPSGATGPWLSHDNSLALRQGSEWIFIPLQNGWRAWVVDDETFLIWNNNAWQNLTQQNQTIQNLPALGINATSDAVNLFSLRSDASLFSHNGSAHRLKINKNQISDIGSIIFQTGFSSRAEIGLLSNDNLGLKVSQNGNRWHEAFSVDAGNGAMSFPNASNDKILETLRYNSYPNSQNGNWFQICQWQTGGNFNTTTAIFDISHRNSLTFQTIKIRFEKRTAGFVSCQIKASGDAFREGEEYRLVASNSDATVRLYNKRSSGHFAERYMSVRHMYKSNNLTTFEFTNILRGTDNPAGDLFSHISSTA